MRDLILRVARPWRSGSPDKAALDYSLSFRSEATVRLAPTLPFYSTMLNLGQLAQGRLCNSDEPACELATMVMLTI